MTVAGTRFVTLTQGEFHASREPVVLSTILGSCVAVCLHDPGTGIGGMNHFLLPDGGDARDATSERYGVNAMEQLINALLRLGARRAGLVAKAFGGANMSPRLAPIGDANARFTPRVSGNRRNYLPCRKLRRSQRPPGPLLAAVGQGAADDRAGQHRGAAPVGRASLQAQRDAVLGRRQPDTAFPEQVIATAAGARTGIARPCSLSVCASSPITVPRFALSSCF
jgi:chemotaxis receptor (MCP) glutamine deamidase CheD